MGLKLQAPVGCHAGLGGCENPLSGSGRLLGPRPLHQPLVRGQRAQQLLPLFMPRSLGIHIYQKRSFHINMNVSSGPLVRSWELHIQRE